MINIFVEYPNIINNDFPVLIFHNRNSAGNIVVNPHMHQMAEVLLLISGKAVINIENNTFSMEEGDIAILNRNIVHSVKGTTKQNTDFLVVQFELDMIVNPSTAFNKKITDTFYNQLDFFSIIKKNNLICRDLTIILNEIDKLNSVKNTGSKCSIMGSLISFVGICIRSMPKNDCKKHTDSIKDRTALYRSLAYIEENYSRKITIEEISEIAGYSIPHYSRVIKKYTGMTFLRYLNNYRINKVCTDISGGKSISSSAYSNGFNSLTSFNRTFKEIHDITPSQWMENMKEID